MYKNNDFISQAEVDGIALNSVSHPQITPWYKRIYQFFFRPKFSKNSIEKLSK